MMRRRLPEERLRLWTGTSAARSLLEHPTEKLNGVLLQHVRIADSVTKAKGEESRVRRFRISTESKDRHGDVVRSRGIQLQHYRKNPVVLFAHDSREPPIGTSPRQERGAGVLDADVKFFDRDVFEFADTIFRIVDAGGLKAASIGFIPLDVKKLPAEGDQDPNAPPVRTGFDFKKVDLLEFSIVPVPANPEAVALAFSEGAAMDPYLNWLDDIQDNWQEMKDVLISIGVDEAELMEVRKAATGGRVSIPAAQVSKDIEAEEKRDADDGQERSAEAHAEGSDASDYDNKSGEDETVIKGPISFRQAHPNGTPAQDRGRPWNAGREVREATVGDLLVMSAWRENKPRNELTKGDFKLPHHVHSSPWPVNFRGTTAAIAVLNGARGGANIPDADRRPVYNHLARHIRDDFDDEPPALKWIEVEPLKNFPDQFVFDYAACKLLVWHEGRLIDTKAVDLEYEKSEDGTCDISLDFDDERIGRDSQFMVQCVAGRKTQWSSKDAFLKWAGEHGFRTDDCDTTKNFWRLRQRDPDDFEDLRTLSIHPGDIEPGAPECKVQAIGGELKDDVPLDLGSEDAADVKVRDVYSALGDDLWDGATERLARSDSYFKIADGKACILGDKAPDGMESLGEAEATFARVIEDRSKYDPRTGESLVKARDLGIADRKEAEQIGLRVVEANEDPDLVVVLGQAVGVLDGEKVYKDRVAFRWAPDRIRRMLLGDAAQDPVEKFLALAQEICASADGLADDQIDAVADAVASVKAALEHVRPQEDEADTFLKGLVDQAGLPDDREDEFDLDSIPIEDLRSIVQDCIKETAVEVAKGVTKEELLRVVGTLD